MAAFSTPLRGCCLLLPLFVNAVCVGVAAPPHLISPLSRGGLTAFTVSRLGDDCYVDEKRRHFVLRATTLKPPSLPPRVLFACLRKSNLSLSKYSGVEPYELSVGACVQCVPPIPAPPPLPPVREQLVAEAQRASASRTSPRAALLRCADLSEELEAKAARLSRAQEAIIVPFTAAYMTSKDQWKFNDKARVKNMTRPGCSTMQPVGHPLPRPRGGGRCQT